MASDRRKHLSQPWFDLVFNGIKTHEGRINDGFWQKLQVGDEFVFWNESGGEFLVQVVDREEFSTFENAINKVGLQNILPPCSEQEMSVKDSVKKVYYEYFLPEQEIEHGVVLFRFDVKY